MFLNSLDIESKRNFIELAYKLAVSDNEYDDSEKEIMKSYMSETGINEIPDTSSIDELIGYFSNKDILMQKIVWIELYGMIMADEKITDQEALIREKVEKMFKLSKEDYAAIAKADDDLKKAYAEIYDIVLSKTNS